VKLGTLAAIPFAGALAVAVLSRLLGGGEGYWLWSQVVMHGLAFAGAIAATAALERRDWMFRAWALYAIAFGLQTVWRIATGPEADPTTAAPQPVVGLLYLVLLNGVAVAGSLLFVLAFTRAGLTLGTSRARATAELAVVAAIAVVLGAPTLAVALRDAAGPSDVARTFTWVLGDVLCFALVAPLWRISRAFSGGALAWPWGFLAVGNLGYLVYDATMVLAGAEGLMGPGSGLRLAAETLYAASSLAALSAALAHRQAVEASRAGVRGGAAS
jgi:hypothetical protein